MFRIVIALAAAQKVVFVNDIFQDILKKEAFHFD